MSYCILTVLGRIISFVAVQRLATFNKSAEEYKKQKEILNEQVTIKMGSKGNEISNQ